MYPTLMLMNTHAHPHTLIFQTHRIEGSLKTTKTKTHPKKASHSKKNSYHRVKCPIIDQKPVNEHLFNGLQH
jgi:hypothetical protein